MAAIDSARRLRPFRQGAVLAWSLLAAAVLTPCPAAAAEVSASEVAPSPPAEPLEIHGFASQGFLFTLRNDYLVHDSTRGSFEFSEVGLNLTKSFADSLRIGVQLFAHDLGQRGGYTVNADWFYLDYRWRNWLGVRLGRLKIPFGLHNEVQDIDAARVPVLLPQSVYPLQTREILFAQTGGEVYGFHRTRAGAFDYRVFGGTIFLDSKSLTPPGSPLGLEFDVPYVVGGRLLWETPAEGLRLGGSVEFVRLDTTARIPAAPTLSIKNQSLLWVASAEYALRDLVLTAEYSRWHADQKSDNPTLSPAIDQRSERAYAMATFRLTRWLQPGAYYSLLYPDTKDRQGRESVQHDLAATLRFDVHPHWLVKVEGHYLQGTAGLHNPLRLEPTDISTAHEHWAAFFLKATARF